MTGNTIDEPRIASKARHSESIEETDNPLNTLNSASSEAGGIARDQSIRRPKLPKMARFSLRQSSLVVPKPSYLRYAGSKNWKSPTENSYEELALGNASLGFEKGTELATAKKMTDRQATERSRKTVNWIFAIVAILIYVIFRLLEQYS